MVIVRRKCREFQQGKFILEEGERTGTRQTSIAEKNVIDVRKMLIDSRRVTYRHIKEALGLKLEAIRSNQKPEDVER